jgi:hypothetical protein
MRSVGVAVVVAALSACVGALIACGSAPVGEEPDVPGEALPPIPRPPKGDGGADDDSATASSDVTLSITLNGTGAGTVTSSPPGVTCSGKSCAGTFAKGTKVTLTANAATGSYFDAWTGACTGAECAPALDADKTVTAGFETLSGTWAGTYTNTRTVNGCTFNNAGNLSVTITATPTSSASFTGLEIRQIPGCQLVNKTTGAAPASALTIAPTNMTGTWSASVSGVGGTLDFPFTASVSGGKLTGSWSCPTCTGSFTLTKQ